MLQEVIQVVDDYCRDNDIFYDDSLSGHTSLIADLGLTSVDFVSLFQKCQALTTTRLSFIKLVMPVEGEYVADLQIKDLSDYIQHQITAESSQTQPEPVSRVASPQVEDGKYKRALFSDSDFELLKSLIQKPSFSDPTPLVTRTKLLFILSSPRSGSTLLQRMLDQHPEIESPEELHLMHYDSFAQRFQALKGEETRHLLGGTVRLRARIKGCELAESQRIEQTYIEQNVPVLRFFEELDDDLRSRYLVDKTPSYSYSGETLQRIAQQFPEARFLYLVRHPSAVLKSLIDSQLQEIIPFVRRYPGEMSAIPEMIWSLCNANIQSMLAGVDPERVSVVTYEDLVGDPKQAIAAILDFLELPYHPDCAMPYGREQSDQIETNNYAGDLKFFLENKIVNERADIWRSFPALLPLSDTTVKLMGSLSAYQD